MNGTTEKVCGLAEAVAWRNRQSGPVVFTNGVFDLVHPGHVELLEAARHHHASGATEQQQPAQSALQRRHDQEPGRHDGQVRVVPGR